MARLWIRCIIAWCLWISAISGSAAGVQPVHILAGTRWQGSLRFLVSGPRGVSLVSADGSTIRTFPACLAVDADTNGRLVLCFRDRMVVLSETGDEKVVPLASLHPLLRFAGGPVRLHLWAGPVLVLPERIPKLVNTVSGARRDAPGVVTLEGGRLTFHGASRVVVLGDMLLMDEGGALVALAVPDLRPVWSVSLDTRAFLDAKKVNGELDCLMDRGYHWRLEMETGKRLSETREDEDRNALVVFHRDRAGEMVVRVTIRETGIMDALSAWKKGRMTALVSVSRDGSDPVSREFSFSIDRIGTFDVELERFPDGEVLHLPDQDVVVLVQKGVPVIRTVPVRLQAVPVRDAVYTWDAVARCPVQVN